MEPCFEVKVSKLVLQIITNEISSIVNEYPSLIALGQTKLSLINNNITDNPINAKPEKITFRQLQIM